MSQALLKPETKLPPIVVEQVKLFNGGGTLVPRQPLIMHADMFVSNESSSGEYYEVDYEPLTLSAMEETYDELIFAIHDYLSHLWESYVEDTATPLTEGAQILRDNLKKSFELQK